MRHCETLIRVKQENAMKRAKPGPLDTVLLRLLLRRLFLPAFVLLFIGFSLAAYLWDQSIGIIPLPFVKSLSEKYGYLPPAAIWAGIVSLAVWVGGVWALRVTNAEIADGRQAEPALWESESHLRTLMDLIPDAMVVYEPHGTVTYLNAAFERIYGWSQEELLGKRIDFVPAEELEATREAWGRTMRREIFLFETKRLTKDGRLLDVELTTAMLSDREGQHLSSVVIHRDITDRKRTELALWESETYLRALMAVIPDALAVYDPQGVVTFVNEAFVRTYGWSEEELLGGQIDFTPPEEIERTREAWARTMRGEEVLFGTKRFTKDGKLLDVELTASVLLDREGRHRAGIVIHRDVTDRKKAEEALKTSHHRLDQIIEFLPDPTLVIDDKGRVEAWNRAMADLTGISAETIIGKGDYEYALPFYGERRPILLDLALHWDESCVEKYISIKSRDDGVLVSESFNPELNGGVFLAATARALYDAEGRPIGAIETLRDITEVKRAEAALRESRRRLAQIIEFLPDPTMVIDSQGIIIGWNQAMAGLTGVEAGAILGKGDHEYAIPFYGRRRPVMIDLVIDYDEEIASKYRSVRREGDRLVSETYFEDFHGRGRTWLWNVAAPLYDREGRVVGAIESVRDITHVKRAEETLKESEERYRTLFERAGDAILIVEPEGLILDANPAALELFGATRDQVLNGDIVDFYWDPSDRSRFREAVDGNGFVHGFSWSIRRKDGSRRLGEINSVAWRNSEGKLIGYLSMVRDITETRVLEEQLRQAQKMEAIGTLTGGIAHDFNNLLTVINGYTEIILLETAEDDPNYKDLEKILETGRKGAELVQRLLALSRKGESSPQPLNINRVVEEAVAVMERTIPKMIEIETDLDADLGMVNADSTQIEQVLMNLCINAREAMPDGGNLLIKTKNVIVNEAYCKLQMCAKAGPHVLLEVTDTGTGMDAETLGRIFDPFFTTKGWDSKKGTGLGLSVAKGIIERHGGWVTCQSTAGTGTTFKVYLPVVVRDVQGETKAEERAEAAPTRGSILLVDDEDLVRDLGKRILEREGYRVITALNGQEALEIYAMEQSAISAVILDLIMPQMGGEKCLEELLSLNPHVKVVVSSGHSLDRTERDRLGVKVKGFVNKPYRTKQLIDVVTRVIAEE